MQPSVKDYQQVELTATNPAIEIKSTDGNLIVAKRDNHLEVGVVTIDEADITHTTWYRLVNGKFGPLSVSKID